ncbi:MAG: hypothetical protein WCF84_25815, partial [Anaerolineae bacterium]
VTLLGGLIASCRRTIIEGDSYRVCESEQETVARRRKDEFRCFALAAGFQSRAACQLGADSLCGQ